MGDNALVDATTDVLKSVNYAVFLLPIWGGDA